MLILKFGLTLERLEWQDDEPRGQIGDEHGLPVVVDQGAAAQQTSKEVTTGA